LLVGRAVHEPPLRGTARYSPGPCQRPLAAEPGASAPWFHVKRPSRIVRHAELRHPTPRSQFDILVSRKPGPGSTWDDVREHWLAVEVLSPSSRLYDHDYKREAYLQLGVAEVWLVDLEARQVLVSAAEPKRTDEPRVEVITWRAPASGTRVELSLPEVFAGI